MNTAEKALIGELVEQIRYWRDTGTKALLESEADESWIGNDTAFHALREILAKHPSPELEEQVRQALQNILQGFAHSVLVSFDGGSSLADKTRLTIIDEKKKPLCRHLHELLADEMIDM